MLTAGLGFTILAILMVTRRTPTEEEEQILLCQYLDLRKILYFHIPNGGYRHVIEGVKFKRMGVKKGVPDLFFPVARKGFHGMFLELKRNEKSAEPRPEQWEWLIRLEQEGYYACYAKGAEQAIKLVNDYMF